MYFDVERPDERPRWFVARPSAKYYPEARVRGEWELKSDAPCGAGGAVRGSMEIVATYHFNGAGDGQFGGADQWPHLTVQISFAAGEEMLRDELARAIQATIDTWRERHGR
jgi:hypothetical protein